MFNSRRCKEIRENQDWSERCTDREPRTDEEEEKNSKISNKETIFFCGAQSDLFTHLARQAEAGFVAFLFLLSSSIPMCDPLPHLYLLAHLYSYFARSYFEGCSVVSEIHSLACMCAHGSDVCADLLHFELLMMKIEPRLDINCSAGAICCTRRRALSKNRKLISCNFAIFFFSVLADGQIIVDKREFP